MKDAMTYANEAGFFSFNVIGWKAEFERLIEAVRADAIADHIRDATKMVQEPVNEALQIASIALQDIACSSQTDSLLWWQTRARDAQKQIAEHLTNATTVEPMKDQSGEPTEKVDQDHGVSRHHCYAGSFGD